MRAVISRRIDELGRIVLPKELRRELGIESGTALDIFMHADDSIVLRKSKFRCVVCGNDETEREIIGERFCTGCLEGIEKALVS